MKRVNCITYLAAVFLLAALSAGCDSDSGSSPGVGEATKDLSIGRMRVSIWPEYDEPSILAIYDGKFEEGADYPIKTSFFVPKGSVISDACSLSYSGQHFCQLYKTIPRGEYDEVSLLLPYPNFYLSFHTPQFDVTEAKRAFTYRIKSNHPVKTMQIDIQQPLRSTAFNISPDKRAAVAHNDSTIRVLKGFKHTSYALHDISEGQESVFKLAYDKKDPKPSVDIKYTSMTGPEVSTTSPYETLRNIRTFIYILFGSGLIAMIALAIRFFRSRKQGD
ncbi:MAG: hypothetical protein Q9M08_07745 [Mariprofundus sp.]|nr:hypothetical protein [Mariprofundus sp.]